MVDKKITVRRETRTFNKRRFYLAHIPFRQHKADAIRDARRIREQGVRVRVVLAPKTYYTKGYFIYVSSRAYD